MQILCCFSTHDQRLHLLSLWSLWWAAVFAYWHLLKISRHCWETNWNRMGIILSPRRSILQRGESISLHATRKNTVPLQHKVAVTSWGQEIWPFPYQCFILTRSTRGAEWLSAYVQWLRELNTLRIFHLMLLYTSVQLQHIRGKYCTLYWDTFIPQLYCY